ncbi:hypothetical protein Smp_000400 [Schistosoma mansoni]|uniref:hypothetical protein n=1 Tax=Schistosoma mansoni TaxID=6183 RepID=UPI00022C81AE|nr:hypothetical protein Smp_000400 [Schistosoma mansoni]|eukprot:XP_018646332.1 hypothetical protein Smp_000400 [Schistosoma mansoni]
MKSIKVIMKKKRKVENIMIDIIDHVMSRISNQQKKRLKGREELQRLQILRESKFLLFYS